MKTANPLPKDASKDEGRILGEIADLTHRLKMIEHQDHGHGKNG